MTLKRDCQERKKKTLGQATSINHTLLIWTISFQMFLTENLKADNSFNASLQLMVVTCVAHCIITVIINIHGWSDYMILILIQRIGFPKKYLQRRRNRDHDRVWMENVQRGKLYVHVYSPMVTWTKKTRARLSILRVRVRFSHAYTLWIRERPSLQAFPLDFQAQARKFTDPCLHLPLQSGTNDCFISNSYPRIL